MWHHSKHIPPLVADARDVVERSIRIRCSGRTSLLITIPEDDSLIAQQGLVGLFIAGVIAFHVTYRNLQHLTRPALRSERRRSALDPQVHRLADVLEPRIPQQRSRQQSRLTKDLKTITDAEHQPAALRELSHSSHHRREAREGTGAQVIAIRKPTRHNHRIAIFELRALVPKIRDWLLGDALDDMKSVLVAIRPRENKNAELHLSILATAG